MLVRGITQSVIKCGKLLLHGGHASKMPTVTRPNAVSRQIHMARSLLARYYTKEHEWIDMSEDVGTVGITKYAQEQLGDIVYCELPEVDADFSAEDSMAVVESVKAASDLYSPVAGRIVETNDKVVDDPSIITNSPMEDGWLVKMKLSNTVELDGLMNADEYAKFLEE